MPTNAPKKYILIEQRTSCRVLYDFNTRCKLEEIMQKNICEYPIKFCDFASISVQEQYDLCSQCVLLISVQGSGLINMLFTQQDVPIIEINFRKHWYCDPVCQDHYNNVIDINENCNGKLQYYPIYHKADNHNLCHLINKRYYEMDPEEYGGGFYSNNPICKNKIYINTDKLTNLIKTILKHN
jgi:hypothetical protein